MSTANLREHSFDGIQEFDNRLPNWWLWTFYGACIFSVGYWIFFHTLGVGDLPGESYAKEQREAAARIEAAMANIEITEEALMKLAAEPAVVSAGEALFKQPALCAQCHGPTANGMVAGVDGRPTPGNGPNLTDNFWINGGSAMDIYRTISEGRPEKGMQSWKDHGITFVQRTVAYVLSLRNRNVPGKAPEDEAKPYEPK